jgi:hypothetical protein
VIMQWKHIREKAREGTIKDVVFRVLREAAALGNRRRGRRR